MGFIYKYTSPSGKCYIGQTVQSIKIRAKKNGEGYKGCPVFYNAIQKYGWNNFKSEILEEVPDNLLDEKEEYYITKYNSLIPNGYNIRKGGGHSESILKKRVYQFDLNGQLIASYDSLTSAAKVMVCNIGSLSEVCSGRKHTCLGYYWSYDKDNNNFLASKKKKVYQFKENGEYVAEFDSCAEADRYYNFPKGTVKNVANKNNHSKRVKGYIFTYEPFIDWEYYSYKKPGPK